MSRTKPNTDDDDDDDDDDDIVNLYYSFWSDNFTNLCRFYP